MDFGMIIVYFMFGLFMIFVGYIIFKQRETINNDIINSDTINI